MERKLKFENYKLSRKKVNLMFINHKEFIKVID